MVRNRLVLLIMTSFVTLVLLGCENDAKDPKNVLNKKPECETTAGVVDYGNGVYYFPCYGANFGNRLSQFIEEHPELELVDAAGDGNGSYGRDQGYFVVFRKKEK